MAKIIKVTAIAAAVGVALYAAAGYIAVPYTIKRILQTGVSDSLHRKVQVKDINFDPWALSLTMRDLTIAGQQNQPPMLDLSRLHLDVSLDSLWNLAPVFDEITIDGLHADIALDDEDIRTLIDGNDEKSEPQNKPVQTGSAELPKFALYNISIKNSSLRVTDKARALDQKITDFNLALPFVSTLPNAKESLITPSLSFNLNDTPIYATGTTKPFGRSLEARLNARIKNLDITPFTRLVPALNSPAMRIESGLLSTNLDIIFQNPTGGKPGKMLIAGSTGLRNLKATQLTDNRTENLLSIKNTSLNIDQIDVIERLAKVKKVSVDGFNMRLINTDKGLRQLNAPAPDTAAPEEKSDTPWQWALGELSLTNGAVTFVDKSINPAAVLQTDKINVSLKNLSGQSDAAPAQLVFSASPLGGSISGTATVSVANAAVNSSIKASGLNLRYLSSYVKQNLGLSVKGFAGTQLDLAVTNGQAGVKGRLFTDNLALASGKQTVFSLSKGLVDIKQCDTGKQRIALNNVQLTSPVVRGVLQDNKLVFGKISLPEKTAANKAAGKTKTQAGQTPEWAWSINKFALSQGRFIVNEPARKTNKDLVVDRIALTAEHFGSEPGQKGRFSAAARQGKGLLDVKGSLTLAPLSTDADINIKQFNLGRLQSLMTVFSDVGTRSGVLTSRGHLLFKAKDKDPAVTWDGDIVLDRFNLVDKKNRDLLTWKKAALTGLHINTPEPLEIDIKQAVLDQPQTEQTQAVADVAQLASGLAGLFGHDKTARRIAKVDKHLKQKIVLNDVHYANGRFTANNVDSASLAGAALDSLSQAVNRYLQSKQTK